MCKEGEILKSKGHTRIQWLLTFTVNLTFLTYGLQCGWLSPTAKILQSPDSPMGRPLTDTEISVLAGAPSVSATFGIIVLVYVVDTFGRKYGVMLTAAFQLMAWILTIYPSNFASLLVGRLFCGFGGGGCFHVVPMYVKEISQDSIRGALGSMITVFQNVGILVMYALGGYIDYHTSLYLVVGIPAINILMLFKTPESPCFLVKMGKMENAAETIAFLRGLDVNDKEVQAEMDSLERQDNYFKSIPNTSFFNIFKVQAWCRGFLILVVLSSVRALNGALVIVNYASSILAISEINVSPDVQSLGIPIFMMIGAFIAMTTIDKLGRKLLLFINFIISTLAFSGFATANLLQELGWVIPGWLYLVALLLAVCCYGGGVTSVPFIVMSEMFNFQVRAQIMACLSSLTCFVSFFQLGFYTAITNSSGAYTSFYIFGAINAIGAIVTIIFLPETAGKSVEQIEEELCKKKKATDKNVAP